MRKLNVEKYLVFIIFIIPLSTFARLFPPPIMEAGEFELVKTGGFEVESLAPVEIYDYHPGKDIYLGYINMFSKGIEIALIDRNGDILVQKKLAGEGPEQYVSSLLSFGFTEKGDIWLHTTIQLLLYDKELNLKSRKKFNPGVMVHIYPGPRHSFPYFYQKKGQDTPSFITHPSSADKNMANKNWSVENVSLIEIYDGVNGEVYEMAPLKNRAHFKGIDESLRSITTPVYVLDGEKNELYLTTRIDKEITVYNLNNHQVVRRIPIKHGSFNSLNPPITRADLPTYEDQIILYALNSKILKFDDNLIGLMYTKEISEAAYIRRRGEDKGYSQIRDPEFKRLIVFEDGKQVSDDLKLPYGDIKAALPGNKILVKMMDSEVEEEVIRYHIYQLVRK